MSFPGCAPAFSPVSVIVFDDGFACVPNRFSKNSAWPLRDFSNGFEVVPLLT